MNELIAKQLGIEYNEAFVIKSKYGISDDENPARFPGL